MNNFYKNKKNTYTETVFRKKDMNKDMIVLLLKRDIQELNLLTDGFEKMSEFPEPLLILAKQKAENIHQSLCELSDTSVQSEWGAIDYQSFGEDTSEVSVMNNFDAPLDVADEILTEKGQTEPVTEQSFTIADEPETLTYEETQTEPVIVSPEETEVLPDMSETVETELTPTEANVEETPEVVNIADIEPEIQIENLPHPEPVIIPNKSSVLVDELMADRDLSLGENLANLKINDIRQAINIGDRFRFQRELFNGNGEVMNKTIAYLNQLQKYEEAMSFLKAKFNWTADNNHADDFMQIVKRRY
jgi:hypothetical protein